MQNRRQFLAQSVATSLAAAAVLNSSAEAQDNEWALKMFEKTHDFGVVAKGSEAAVRLPPDLQTELEEALTEADREDGISADELLEKLRQYG